MRPEARKYLFDIRVAADRIADFCADRSFEQYHATEMLRAAVERKFTIMGEAMARLEKSDPDTAALIPQYRKIVAFRNIIVHGYADVDDRIVWGIIEGHLPALRTQLALMLDQPT